ncbi:MAG TPA: ABC transporter permease [Anaerolineae bacterium]|nr:ABC transporter permease [Anaerolineae bacterium]
MAAITADPTTPAAKARRHSARWNSPWLNAKLLLGLGILLLIASTEFIGPFFVAPKLAIIGSSPTNVVPVWVTNYDKRQGFKPPNPEYPLGTESKGRDMLAVILVGTPRTLRVGLIGAGIGILVGIALGFLAGFNGGWIDSSISTLADVMLTIPGLAVLVVIASYATELEIVNMGAIMALFAWPLPTRVVRAQVLSMRERGFIQMAQLSGTSNFDIMFREIMPNLLPYLAASFTESVALVILATIGVETLGLGPTRIPTLGMTINNALQSTAIYRGMYWWWGPPIVMLIFIFVGLFLMTVGLDEIANPRLRQVRRQ